MKNVKPMHPSRCRISCDADSCTCQPNRHLVEKPKAIDLAEWLESVAGRASSAVAAAAELRRLSAVNSELLDALQDIERTAGNGAPNDDPARVKARALIAKAIAGA